MNIDIPPDQRQKLTEHATAAGFDSVERYVTEFVLTLADRPTAKQIFTPLSDDELNASLAGIDQCMKQINAGQGLSVEQAHARSLGNLGPARE